MILKLLWFLFQVGMANAKFLDIWMDSYKTFNSNCWGCNSVTMAHRLAEIFPHNIYVEETAFTNPTYSNDKAMYGSAVYNYTKNYSIHIYNHFDNHFIPSNEEELRGYNCTLGRVMRDVLYGSPELLDKEHVRIGLLKKT